MNNLIGISGKIGSGKDLVGEIIQYLIDMDSVSDKSMNFYSWLLTHPSERRKSCSGYEIKKFADKLKDIVCMLIGCTRQQLEDREFKEKELGEEWQGYQVSWDCPGTEWEGYFKTEEEALEYLNDKDAETTLESAYHDEIIRKITLTPRTLLQILGTDCGRKLIHPNIWINALFADYKKYDFNQAELLAGALQAGLNSKWIITDVRFKNEADIIKEKGGIIIRVDRPCKECGNSIVHKMSCNTGYKEHVSETDLDAYTEFDYVIKNDSSIEHLINKVKKLKL